MSSRPPGNPAATATRSSGDPMCVVVRYLFEGKAVERRFLQAGARLPVKMKRGDRQLFLWGRRQTERGELPAGGWARLAAIQAGDWDRFAPVPVKLELAEFAVLDVGQRLQWFPVVAGRFVQGLMASLGNEQRVYVVVLDATPEEATFERWPRLMSAQVQE